MITPQQFAHELGRAQTFARLETDPLKAAYWAGYQRGLRRNYHGATFGTADEHTRWTQAAKSDDAERKAVGQGYKDGLNIGGNKP